MSSRRFRAVHQITPYLGYGDAVGNQVLGLRDLLREWGYTSDIFTEGAHPQLGREGRYYRDYLRFSHPNNLLILHYCGGGDYYRFAQTLPDHLVLYYHNLTPAHFLYRYNGEMARALSESRRDLGNLVRRMPAIAASPYNQLELEGIGFRVVGQAPYLLTFDKLDEGVHSDSARHLRERFDKTDSHDWLYVGRLVPNKCVEDIIKAFYYYHTRIVPQSRLLLVGAGDGMEAYVAELERLTARLKLSEVVVFAGHYGARDGLGVFYQMADLYVCMSEHEGFCIPLVEAMHYDLPILAYAATGVPYTMGDDGVLVHRKDYPLIAEWAYEVIANDDLRLHLIAGQRKRLSAFAPEQACLQFQACLEALAA